eukprot:7977689-Lingulodinium_polyedra.AAC.1
MGPSVDSLVGIYRGRQWVLLTSTGGYIVGWATGSAVDSIAVCTETLYWGLQWGCARSFGARCRHQR